MAALSGFPYILGTEAEEKKAAEVKDKPKKVEVERSPNAKAQLKELSKKLQQNEVKMEELRSKVAKLDAELLSISSTDHQKLHSLSEEREAVQAKLNDLEELWMELSEKIAEYSDN
jgi:ATP-binding cassette subfamily F protein uup